MNDDLINRKKQLRKECIRKRKTLTPEDQKQASGAICQFITDWDLFQRANIVTTYLPMRSEIDLTPLIDHWHEKKWLIPRVHGRGLMSFHEYEPQKLVRHRVGMLEPSPDSPVTPPQDIQLILAPGLAFDKGGWRLGYGGGYYDRFLSGFTGSSAGITYHDLLVPEVPHGSLDIPMDYVISETGIEASL